MNAMDLKARADALNRGLVALEQYPWESLPVEVSSAVECAMATLRIEFKKVYAAYREATRV